MATFQASTGPQAATASTTKTFLQLATTASGSANVFKWWVGSDATSAGTATSAIRVQVGLFSSTGVTGTALSTVFWDWSNNGLAATSTATATVTAEGTGAPTYFEEHVLGLTQSELVIWEPTPRVVVASSFWRIRLIIPAGIGTTNIYAGVAWTE